MQKSRLPRGGTNLFQLIKAKSVEAEQRGAELIKLSIGQPTGPALLSARTAAAAAVMSGQESMHEYQDNGSPGVPNFAQSFVQWHVRIPLVGAKVDFLPIPGIKPMLGLISLACGSEKYSIIPQLPSPKRVAMTTRPGYPTPRDWCNYLRAEVHELLLSPENDFRFLVEVDVPEGTQLIMMNYPHNPSGQIAIRKWLEKLCEHCVAQDIRLFNDAAYAALWHDRASCTLTEVAVNYPELSWAEAFSASKLIGNGTGWRAGAIVGSPDFVGDIKTIKGNTDSGFVAPMAAGVLAAIENDEEGINQCRNAYGRRLQLLIRLLTKHGMQLAVRPGAGFFSLWRVPKWAFGEEIRDAEHFNFMMIERTGVVGVHFPPYIRYAVCADIEVMAKGIDDAFEKAKVSYEQIIPITE